MSIKHDDVAAAATAVAARISLADIEAAIEQRLILTGSEIVSRYLLMGGALTVLTKQTLETLTLAVVVLKNGYIVIGTSAPASPANYNRQLSERLAYENCLRQIWPLMGFALRQQLSENDANLPESGDAQ